MKKILLLAIAAILFACTPKHDGYTITGTISGEGISEGKAYLSDFQRVDPIRDTVDFKDGKFVFTGKIVTPDNYSITIEGINGSILLFLDNSNIKINAEVGNFEKAEIIGGVTNDLLATLLASRKEIVTKNNLDTLIAEFYNKETTPERQNEIMEIYEGVQKEIIAIDNDFLAANPTSFYSITQLMQKAEESPIEEMEAKIAQFEALPQFVGNRYLNDLKEAVNTIKALQPGMQAPEFTLNDPEGNPVSLSSVYSQNKITMIDFWAGWCNPCRNFNPHLLEIYKKLNKEGFGILGVSLDREEESWKNAIKDDKLPWTQVSELKFWNSIPVKEYYVKSIPANIFVDQEGKIIKRKVERDNIEPFIREYLGL